MIEWLQKLPLPLWATISILGVALGAGVWLLLRKFRLKKIIFSLKGPAIEFKRKEADQPTTGRIDQEISATETGEIEDVEQTAEGTGIKQKIQSSGKIKGAKQDARDS